MLSKLLALGTTLTGITFSHLPAHATTTAPVAALTAPTDSVSTGTLKLGKQLIPYHTVAGTLLIHGQHYDDSHDVLKQRHELPESTGEHKDDSTTKAPPVASMFYTAYFRDVASTEKRPVIFFYNGGPGSASVWLHMGSFGPLRVSTPGDTHLPAPPYSLINNQQSLLDIADLVFIDAPGTGFSRINGTDAQKEFYSLDGDAAAFTHFITQFLARYHRFNSPRYLFGESYGTLRSAVVANKLAQDESLDLNGIILLSQIFSYDNDPDGVTLHPGMDLPYVLALPTYAATAWYHHSLPEQPKELKTFLKEVEHFASTDYLLALQQGSDLSDADKQKIAETLHRYTGISTAYILRANLRLSGGMFEHELLQDRGLTTGRLDTRYSSPSIDPLGKEPLYDAQSSALSSAYLSLFNDYIRRDLHYGAETPYLSISYDANNNWDTHHDIPLPGGQHASTTPNVMPDLAMALKTNPNLKVMLNGGYYDMATPYYQGVYEMKHLPIPASLQKNISFYQYPVGHMVYVDQQTLQQLHDNVAAFIQNSVSH